MAVEGLRMDLALDRLHDHSRIFQNRYGLFRFASSRFHNPLSHREAAWVGNWRGFLDEWFIE